MIKKSEIKLRIGSDDDLDENVWDWGHLISWVKKKFSKKNKK